MLLTCSVFFAVLCFVSHLPSSESASGALDWTYEGWREWSKKYPHCNSAHQSPIDIVTKDAIYDVWLKPFHFIFNESTKSSYEIYNDGSNVVITFGSTEWMAIFDDYDKESFKPAAMHFHWGLTDNTGSEHQKDGVTYALEGHIVMYNSRDYNSFAEAVKNVNGLAVQGVFFEHNDEGTPNPTLEAITKAMNVQNILQCNCTKKMAQHTAPIPFFHLDSIFPKNRRFFRYKGSLTTPPCTENVLWSLYHDRMKVTTEQLKIFRKVRYSPLSSSRGSFMAGNHRPVLPLNPESPLNAPRYVASSFDVALCTACAPAPVRLLVLVFGAIFALLQ